MLIAGRPVRAHLGMLGAPLAIAAALMSGLWWAVVPLTGAAWWWSPNSWGWEWLIALGRGVVCAEWAYLGTGALLAFPDARLTVGAGWAALPGCLALYTCARRRAGDEKP